MLPGLLTYPFHFVKSTFLYALAVTYVAYTISPILCIIFKPAMFDHQCLPELQLDVIKKIFNFFHKLQKSDAIEKRSTITLTNLEVTRCYLCSRYTNHFRSNYPLVRNRRSSKMLSSGRCARVLNLCSGHTNKV